MKHELDKDALYRSREHAEALIEEFDFQDLWDEYGIVGDLVVCFPLILSSVYSEQ